MKLFSSNRYLSLFVMGGLLLNACGSPKATPQEGKMQQEKINNLKESTHLDKDLLAALSESTRWDKDIIHPVDWNQVLQLVQAGANIHQKDENGNSVLVQVITAFPTQDRQEPNMVSRTQVIEELLNRNISSEEAVAALWTLLDEPNRWEDDQIHAVHWDQVLLLVKAITPVNQVDTWGNSIWKRVITAPIPNETGTDLTKESTQRSAVIKELLDRDISVEEIIDKRGNTALLYASTYGSLPVVETLLKHHANVNIVNQQGQTALFLANKAGHTEIVALLKQAGAKD